MAKRFMGMGVLAVLAAIAACNTSGASGDCTTLTTCCSQLADASNKSECLQVVSMQDPTSCGEAQAAFEGDALCAPPATSTGSGATGCAGLSACCPSLGASATACEEIVSLGQDSTCTTELSSLQAANMCTTSVTISTGGTGCSGLGSCCGSLPAADQATCNEYVSLNQDATCTAALTSFKQGGYCGGGTIGTGPTTGTGPGTGGTDCSDLSTCCNGLSSAFQTSCNEVVTAGISTECAAELSTLQTEGMCGGSSSTGTGGGTGGSGCSALSACCGSVPAADQSACNEYVTLGQDATCTSALSSFKAAGYCN